MKPKNNRTQTITVWQTTHIKPYPTAQRKRIYARPKTVTLTQRPKPSVLSRILED